MSVMITNMIDYYNYLDYDLSDPRTRHNTFLCSPICMFLLGIFYYKLVKSWGPKFMKDREPFDIKAILIVYNSFQIIASATIAIASILIVWWPGYYSVKCQPISRETTPKELLILRFVKYYYWLKIIDLLDTVFFVLRKKQNQVSFLHVYHHLIMILLGFMTYKYIPAGHGAMVGTLNCIVHTVMYTYYLLTSISPEYKKSIWWKKHLTQIQILQFFLLFLHFAQVLFQPDCKYPKWISFVFIPQNLFVTFMFTDFYIKEYIVKKKK